MGSLETMGARCERGALTYIVPSMTPETCPILPYGHLPEEGMKRTGGRSRIAIAGTASRIARFRFAR